MDCRSVWEILSSTAQVTVPPAVPSSGEPHFAPSRLKSTAMVSPSLLDVDQDRSVGDVSSPVDETEALVGESEAIQRSLNGSSRRNFATKAVAVAVAVAVVPCERRNPYAAASRWGAGSLRSQGRRMQA